MLNVLVVIGTRPEAIKMAPVLCALNARPDGFRTRVCLTGQHRDLLHPMLDLFSIRPDWDFGVMRENQSLGSLTAEVLRAFEGLFQTFKPDWMLVQGDTTTAMAASLAAFYGGVKVAHVEAGLRTGDKRAPFPEEINRRLVSVIADLHFAPTARAQAALVAEGHDPATVLVTGNTVIDSVYWVRERVRTGALGPPEAIRQAIEGRRLILVTAHRRENQDGGLAAICAALKEIVTAHEDVVVVYPVHPNPNVQEPVQRLLAGVPRIVLAPPLDYGPFTALLDAAFVVVTDSGGIQEEATALGKPIVVMRDVTERPEAVESGNAVLAGARRDKIVEVVGRILTDPTVHARMARPSAVFGDGHAGERIAERLGAGEEPGHR